MESSNYESHEEMKKDERLRGGRCVGQIRCSRKEQAKRSLGQQRDWLQAFASVNEMEYVTDMQEAVSASQIRKRPDLERIFERKRTVNDFDTVIVQDLSRLTRGGVKRGLQLYFRFVALGIRLVSLVDGFIEGDEMIIKAAQRFQEARAQAKANAMNIRRGILKSRKLGKISYTSSIPFGIDRLISNSQGVPQFRLRLLRDGSQQKLSPDGQNLLHTFPPNGYGERHHHIMQADEYERFVPGDPVLVTIMERIYRQFFLECKTVYSIALGLNDEGISSPRGREWNMGTIRKMLRNPVYLNRAIGDMKFVGEFYKNGPSHPLPVKRDENDPVAIPRPEKEWHRESHPLMDSFFSFDEATKARIYEWQLEKLRHENTKTTRRKGGNRHKDSQFILTGIIFAKHFGSPLTGYCNGKGRYYILSRGMNVPKTGANYKRCFNAELLECAVKPFVKQVLDSYGGIRSAVEATLKSQAKAKAHDVSALPALIADRNRILAQLDFWITQLGDLGPDLVGSKTEPLKRTVSEIGVQIDSLQRQRIAPMWEQDVDGPKLDGAMARLALAWNTLSNEAVRRVLKLLCHAVVDFDSGEVDVELRLPSWIARSPALLASCLEDNTVDGVVFETIGQCAIALRKQRFLYKGLKHGGIIPLDPELGLTAA